MTERGQNNEKKPEQAIQKTEPAKPQPPQLVSVDSGDFQYYLDTAKFNQLWRVATVFAGSQTIPEQYRNKPNDCFIAIHSAIRSNCDPLTFMQGSYVVYGKPGIEGKLAIALINTRGPFKGPIQWRYEGTGANRKCTAYQTHKITGQLCEATVTWEMAEKEGWTKKQGSKWLTMPDQMFAYRSAAFLGRLHCPEVLFGMQTLEELEDILPPEVLVTPELGVNGLLKRIDSKDTAIPPLQPPPTIPAPIQPANNKRYRRTKLDCMERERAREKAAELDEARNLAQQAAKEAAQPVEPVIKASAFYHCELCKADIPADEVEIMENDLTKEKGLYHNACGYAVEEVK